MLRLGLQNPFGKAPIYYVSETNSTMDEAKALISASGEGQTASGTVVTAGYQRQGRGRTEGRVWSAKPNENLLFTLILAKADVQTAGLPLSLICGLSVAEAAESCLGLSRGTDRGCEVKWPNDVLICGKKLAGILIETKGNFYLAGIGINCNQMRFPGGLEEKATSLALQSGKAFEPGDVLLPVLAAVSANLAGPTVTERFSGRLFGMGRVVTVRKGSAESFEEFPGRIKGVSPSGSLIVHREGGGTVEVVAGEIATDLYRSSL